jgi:hypothetical protein
MNIGAAAGSRPGDWDRNRGEPSEPSTEEYDPAPGTASQRFEAPRPGRPFESPNESTFEHVERVGISFWWYEGSRMMVAGCSDRVTTTSRLRSDEPGAMETVHLGRDSRKSISSILRLATESTPVYSSQVYRMKTGRQARSRGPGSRNPQILVAGLRLSS